MVSRLCIVLVLIVGLAWFIYRLIFSDKSINPYWAVVLGVGLIVFFYVLSPIFRIYGNHGFFRAGIVYQILNGNVPPQDFLFAGQPLRSPWGFPWLSAQIARLFNTTPFYAFAIINVFAMVISIIFLILLSKMIIRDTRTNVYAVLISLFGISFVDWKLLTQIIQAFGISHAEIRIVPAFHKYICSNGMPIGIALFLAFVFFLFHLWLGKKILLWALGMLASFMICGFIYPPILPGLISSAFSVGLLRIIVDLRKQRLQSFMYVTITLLILAVGVLPLWKYFRVVSSGVDAGIRLFDLSFFFVNFINGLVLLFPIILVLAFSWKDIIRKSQIKVLADFFAVIAATACCYLFIHVADFTEYKFMMLSTIILGIVGGMAFKSLERNISKRVVLLLLILFIYPSFSHVREKLMRYGNHPLMPWKNIFIFKEHNHDISVLDEDENDLYRWIKSYTDRGDLFADTEWVIPIFAQRALYMGFDKPNAIPNLGYSFTMEMLRIRHGYDEIEFKRRTDFLRNLYGYEKKWSRQQLIDEGRRFNLFVVVRWKEHALPFDPSGLSEIFRSSNGRYSLFCYK